MMLNHRPERYRTTLTPGAQVPLPPNYTPPQQKSLHLGDTQDDDSIVLGELVQQETEPPDIAESIAPSLAPDYTPAQRPTRILSGTVLVEPLWPTPTMILPVDLNRKSFCIFLRTVDAAHYIRISDDPQKLEQDYGAGRITGTFLQPMFDGHTGPIWVTARGSTVAVRVSWWAVTE